jgi:hypothetical protein
MSAGDKDRSGFHRLGGSLTQARSRASTEEHEHCTRHMLADLPGIKCLRHSRPREDASFGTAFRPGNDLNKETRRAVQDWLALEMFVSPK